MADPGRQAKSRGGDGGKVDQRKLEVYRMGKAAMQAGCGWTADLLWCTRYLVPGYINPRTLPTTSSSLTIHFPYNTFA